MKTKIILMVLLILFLATFSTQALHTAGVSRNRGAMTFMLTDRGDNFGFGGEFGLTNQWGIMGNINVPFSRIGAKYQFVPNMALLFGVSSNSDPFFGINGHSWINEHLDFIYEINFLVKHNLAVPYELGARIGLAHNLDFRFGFFGHLESDMNFPNLKAGVGIRF